jgi:hypothetical protein
MILSCFTSGGVWSFPYCSFKASRRKKEKIRKEKQFFLLQAANSFANSFTKHSKRKYLICVESGNAYRHGLAMDLRWIHFPQERARS